MVINDRNNLQDQKIGVLKAGTFPAVFGFSRGFSGVLIITAQVISPLKMPVIPCGIMLWVIGIIGEVIFGVITATMYNTLSGPTGG